MSSTIETVTNNRRWRGAAYGFRTQRRGEVTGDPRRWPDVWLHPTGVPIPGDPAANAETRRIVIRHGMHVTDDDLVAAVEPCFAAWLNTPGDRDVEIEQVLITVSDAAIDEQDRRNGVVQPEPA